MTVAEFCEGINISWRAYGHQEALEQVGIDKECWVSKIT